MNFILEFEKFIKEVYPGERMAEKDPRYWVRRPHEQRIAGVVNYINTLERGKTFEYYTSGGTTIGIFAKEDGNYIYYYEFPSIETIAARGEFYLKPARMKIDRIGGIGAPSKDELTDMEKEYDEAVTDKYLDPNVSWVKAWYEKLKEAQKSAIRYK